MLHRINRVSHPVKQLKRTAYPEEVFQPRAVALLQAPQRGHAHVGAVRSLLDGETVEAAPALQIFADLYEPTFDREGVRRLPICDVLMAIFFHI